MVDLKKFLRPKPLVLITLEGWGVAPAHPANAISEALPQYFQYLISHYPALTLRATGPAVGSLASQRSGSELGHLAIGLGRPVVSLASLIDEAITSKIFAETMKNFLATIHSGNIHLVGLLSNVQTEVSLQHLRALLSAFKEFLPTERKVFLHAFLDGRDMPAKGGQRLLGEIEKELEVCKGTIASVIGRLYALDVHEHSARLEKTAAAIIDGQGNISHSATQTVADSYAKKIFDEEFSPTVITDANNNPLGRVSQDDTIIFFNFNPISIQPLVRCLINKLSSAEKMPRFVSLTDYMFSEIESLFQQSPQNHSLGEIIAEAEYRQMRISDSEGYVPITVFLNGGESQILSGEDRRLVPIALTNVAAHKPQSSTEEVSKEVVKVVEENRYDFIAVNFSALDRAGHSSNLRSAIAAVKSIDLGLRKIVEAVLHTNGVVVIVGSHGLAEQLVATTGEKFSPHTSNPVPFILVGQPFAGYSLGLPEAIGGDLSLTSPVGSLIDVAPTILKLMKLTIPAEMTGQSFFDELKLV